MSEEKVEIERFSRGDERALARRYSSSNGYYPEAYLEDYENAYADGETPKDGSNTIRDLFSAVRKKKWLILGLVIVITSITAVEVLRIRPIYTASTVIEVRKENMLLLVPNLDSDPDNALTLNTKMLIFKSRPLLEDVVNRLKLDQNREFLDVSQNRSHWDTIKAIFKRDQAHEPSETEETAVSDARPKPSEGETPENELDLLGLPVANPRLDRMVAILQNGLNVERIKDTQALKISFSHKYPKVAALVADGLTERFIKRNFENKIDRFTNTSNWLESSTKNLKVKAQEAEQALANYTRDHNIFNTPGQTPLTDDRLVKLHDQVTRTELDIMLKQSIYDEVQQGRGARLPEAFGDPRIAELQKRLNDLAVTAAQLSATYGPENENIKAVKQQMLVVQEQLQESRMALEERLKGEYEKAVRDDKALKVAFEEAKVEAVRQDQAAIQYNILKGDVVTANSLYTEFLHKTNQANLELAQQRNNINVIQPAQIPKSPDGPTSALAILMAFVLSVAGGVGLAFVLERFDTTIRNVGDVDRYVQLPTLGVIPAIKRTRAPSRLEKKNGRVQEPLSIAAGRDVLPGATERLKGNDLEDEIEPAAEVTFLPALSLVAEAYRTLRTSVLLSAAERPPKTILFTSGRPGEGKTTTAVNTAVSLAQLGSSVLIIDADLRKPATHKGFSGVKNDLGLSTYLSRDVEVDGLIQKLKISNLSLLACGPIPPNPAELISSNKMKVLLKSLAARYDHIVIDSPPLMYVTDSVILSTLVDGVILVVHGGKSTRDVVRQSRQMLGAVGAKVFGVVLNNVSARNLSESDLTYYPYHSDDSHQRDEDRVSDLLS
jgi:succinoglycan biosynthesis transport protein ExoP